MDDEIIKFTGCQRDAANEQLFQEFVRVTEGWSRLSQDTLALQFASFLTETAAYESAGRWSNQALEDLLRIAAQLEWIAMNGPASLQH